MGKHLTGSEIRFVRNCKRDKWAVNDILDGVKNMRGGRKRDRPSRNTISGVDHLKKKPRGRPEKYFNKDRRKLLNRTIQKATRASNVGHEITSSWLRDKCGFDCSLTTINREVRSLGYRWLRPKSFGDLSRADKESRVEFCQKWHNKSISTLKQRFGLVFDEKCYTFRSTAAGRLYSARKRNRGVYCKKGTRHLASRPSGRNDPGRTKASKVNVIGGIFNNKVESWIYYKRSVSSEISKKIVDFCNKKGIKKILCDNHRTHTSAETTRALTAAGIARTDFPKRSPDLMPLDFSVWEIITQRMISQENDMAEDFVEKISEYKARLRKTAKRVGETIVDNVWQSWKNRMAACIRNKGGCFSEKVLVKV